LSDQIGTATLHVPGAGPSPGASLQKPAPDAASGRGQLCRVDTLDRVLSGETGLRFMKIDVEGHELQVFRGAKETIARNSPVILFECEARHLGETPMTDVFAFLHERKYTGQFFSPEGLRPVAEFDPAIHQARTPGRFWDAPGYCNNFVFKPSARS
jgi:hypothetical protein